MLCKLLSHMDREKFQNIVVSLQDEGVLGKDIRKAGIPLLTLNMKPGIPNPVGIYRLGMILKKTKPGILQTWLYHADLLGMISRIVMRVPIIVWNVRCSHLKKDDHPSSLFVVINFLAKLSHMTNAVIVNSEIGKKIHRSLGYKPTRWEVIPNGFDTDLFCPSHDARSKIRRDLGLPENTLLVGLIARFNPMKDHDNFLYAAKLILQELPNVHFILSGQGVDFKNDLLHKKVKEFGIGNNVHMLGERTDISDIIAALDVACSSSYSEGFPNAVGEAMSCAVPCVVTDVGDCAFIVADTGIAVPPRNPHVFAEALKAVLTLPSENRIEMGILARKRIVENFSIDAITQRYERLYEEVTKNQKH